MTGTSTLTLKDATIEKLRSYGQPGETDDEILMRLFGKLDYIAYMEKKVVDMRVKAIRHRAGRP